MARKKKYDISGLDNIELLIYSCNFTEHERRLYRHYINNSRYSRTKQAIVMTPSQWYNKYKLTTFVEISNALHLSKETVRQAYLSGIEKIRNALIEKYEEKYYWG